ncbi:MAG: hypothetical protein KIT13_00910 [Burkholderiales bacterium]|nr:hypothetical protein [Burkholderiales bacterium]MCW5603006.1 hypothetical protein [Burkholderiales bacterium]
MDVLNLLDTPAFRLWFAQSAVLFFFISGLALLAVGLALIVNSAAALRFFGGMNRWVSMRRATRPLEIPRDTQPLVRRYRHLIAVFVVAGGVFAVSGLLTQYDARAAVRLLGLESLRPDLALWLTDSARWLLIAGNVLGIAVGLLLAFSPGLLSRMEARGSDWYSERRMAKGADAMNTGLDAQVTAHPRAAGIVIVLMALLLIGAFGLLLPAVW